MREKILSYLRDADDAGAHVHQIARHLGVSRSEQHHVRKALKELVHAGELQRGRGRTFHLRTSRPVLEGTLSVARDGYGFVAVPGQEGRDVFVPRDKIGGGLHGDRVRVVEEWSGRNRRSGAVVLVLERNTTRAVGRLEPAGRGWVLKADDPALGEVRLDPRSVQGAEAGARVGVCITAYPERGRGHLEGEVERCFDGLDTVHDIVESVIYQAGLRAVFPPEVHEQAERLPGEVSASEWEGRREDWRELPLVTIDGEDARDFDDAVAWVPDRGYRAKRSAGTLYVAIADVAHYVPLGSPLDDEARARGTSVYFPNRVVPMLPEALSNHLCSLRPGVDRLAVGTRLQLDEDGRVRAASVHRVVIHSHARLTYTKVQRLFDGERTELPPAPLRPMLRALQRLSDALRESRIAGGGIDMELSEPYFELSEDGARVEGVHARKRTAATGVVEELMLLANRHAARLLEERGVPAIYRVHEAPDDEKLRRFLVAASHTTGEARELDSARPAQIQAMLDRCTDADKKGVLHALLLRAMQRARYSEDNAGHYGLGFEAYAHTTSPIRRYPDLVVQRLLARHIMGTEGKPSRADQAPRPGGKLQVALAEIARECSEREQKAQAAAWQAEGMLQALYMSERIGEVYEAVVSGVASHGMFTTLGDTHVSGYLPMLALPPDEYVFNDRLVTLTGKRTRGCVALGDRLQVQIARADVPQGRVEVALAPGAPPLPRAR